jgi:hypothetical protein
MLVWVVLYFVFKNAASVLRRLGDWDPRSGAADGFHPALGRHSDHVEQLGRAQRDDAVRSSRWTVVAPFCGLSAKTRRALHAAISRLSYDFSRLAQLRVQDCI